MTLLLFYLVEIGLSSLYGFAIAVIGIAIALWLWKSGFPAAAFTSQNQLLTARTTERDDAVREKEELKKELQELKEELKTLRREITQRYEIHHEDQAKIRELESDIWKLKRM